MWPSNSHKQIGISANANLWISNQSLQEYKKPTISYTFTAFKDGFISMDNTSRIEKTYPQSLNAGIRIMLNDEKKYPLDAEYVEISDGTVHKLRNVNFAVNQNDKIRFEVIPITPLEVSEEVRINWNPTFIFSDSASVYHQSTDIYNRVEQSLLDKFTSIDHTQNFSQTSISNDDPYIEHNNNIDNNLFYYQGNGYAYSIDNDKKEMIYLIDSSGNKTEMIRGGGLYEIIKGKKILQSAGIDSFTVNNTGDYIEITVNYIPQALEEITNAELRTTYIFHESSINIKPYIKFDSSVKLTGGHSRLARDFLNNPMLEKTIFRVNGYWNYPKNGDTPYLDFESLVTVKKANDDYKLYSFIRSENQVPNPVTRSEHNNNLKLFFEETNNLEYVIDYDLVLQKISKDDDNSALFKGKNSDFAFEIKPTIENDDQSTVFEGSSRELSMSVKNITDKGINFDLRYDIRNYYGEIIDIGVFKNNLVKKNETAERKVKIGDKYGMYYVNIYVKSDKFEYDEVYTAALVKPGKAEAYDHPFGVSSVYGRDAEDFTNIANLLKKTGLSNVHRLPFRDNMVYDEETGATAFAKELQRLNIRIPGQLNVNDFKIDEDYSSITQKIKNKEANFTQILPYINSSEFTATLNNDAEKNGIEKSFEVFRDLFFPLTKEFSEKYNTPYVLEALGYAQTYWMDKVAAAGIWDEVDIIASFTYGHPQMPDYTEDAYQDTKWKVEAAMRRLKAATAKYGEKPIYITEVGYPTPTTKTSAVSQRTAADYSARIAILGLLYEMEKVNFYTFQDRTSYFEGFMTNIDKKSEVDTEEMHFGLFYNHDYYGIVKPKTAAIAFANFARTLDGAKKVSINEQYTTNTIRFFDIEFKNGTKSFVGWSNIYEMPTKEQNSDRIPYLPWENEWIKNEILTYKTDKDVIVTDIMGNEEKIKNNHGEVSIKITGSPIFIKEIVENNTNPGTNNNNINNGGGDNSNNNENNNSSNSSNNSDNNSNNSESNNKNTNIKNNTNNHNIDKNNSDTTNYTNATSSTESTNQQINNNQSAATNNNQSTKNELTPGGNIIIKITIFLFIIILLMILYYWRKRYFR